MARRLINLLTAFSAFTLIASLLMIAVGPEFSFAIRRTIAGHRWTIHEEYPRAVTIDDYQDYEADAVRSSQAALAAQMACKPPPPLIRIVVPHIVISILSVPLPVIRLVHWHTRRTLARTRRAAGLCVACGYDLQSTPDRCPECGTIA